MDNQSLKRITFLKSYKNTIELNKMKALILSGKPLKFYYNIIDISLYGKFNLLDPIFYYLRKIMF